MLDNRSQRIFLSILAVLFFALFQAHTSFAQIDYPSFPAAGLSFVGDGGFEGSGIRLIRTLRR